MFELKIKLVENRRKYIPAKIKQFSSNYFYVQPIDRAVKVRTTIETIILPEPDYAPQPPEKYVSSCFFQTTPAPCWYRESLILNINSTKRHFKEEICFEHKLAPLLWSEGVTKKINTGLVTTRSECFISVEKSDKIIHYISLEPQQKMAL